MKRIGLFLLLILVIIPLVCIILRPRLTDVDFLTLDLTLFSISLGLMTFTAPMLMKFRDKLLDVDAALLKRDQGQIDLYTSLIDTVKTLDEQNPQDSNKETIKKLETLIKIRDEKRRDNPFPFSDSISLYFHGTQDVISWCLIAIVLHIFVNEILYTSDAFRNFVRDDLSCVTASWNLSVIKSIVSSYIKLGSLTLQLYFLFRVSEDAMSTIQSLKFL